MTNEEVLSTLNDLIETCKDGEHGFCTAAESVEIAHLKTLFDSYCQQRGQLAAELETLVRRLGGSPTDSGSLSGAVHRGWIAAKSALTGQDDFAILAECERGEDIALEHYQSALDAGLPSDVHKVVSRQHAAVKCAHDRIRELEKTHEKVS